uniref:Uncharacterized protein n=1 Tax=Rhizophora mucronata TaxID=61149 RepID=A0A2P2NR76_RHIMU
MVTCSWPSAMLGTPLLDLIAFTQSLMMISLPARVRRHLQL